MRITESNIVGFGDIFRKISDFFEKDYEVHIKTVVTYDERCVEPDNVIVLGFKDEIIGNFSAFAFIPFSSGNMSEDMSVIYALHKEIQEKYNVRGIEFNSNMTGEDGVKVRALFDDEMRYIKENSKGDDFAALVGQCAIQTDLMDFGSFLKQWGEFVDRKMKEKKR